jgi:hypothetical protein
MIDFDVVTGPSPAEKPAEPVLKPPVGRRPADAASRLARETATPPRPPDRPQRIPER